MAEKQFLGYLLMLWRINNSILLKQVGVNHRFEQNVFLISFEVVGT